MSDLTHGGVRNVTWLGVGAGIQWLSLLLYENHLINILNLPKIASFLQKFLYN